MPMGFHGGPRLRIRAAASAFLPPRHPRWQRRCAGHRLRRPQSRRQSGRCLREPGREWPSGLEAELCPGRGRDAPCRCSFAGAHPSRRGHESAGTMSSMRRRCHLRPEPDLRHGGLRHHPGPARGVGHNRCGGRPQRRPFWIGGPFETWRDRPDQWEPPRNGRLQLFHRGWSGWAPCVAILAEMSPLTGKNPIVQSDDQTLPIRDAMAHDAGTGCVISPDMCILVFDISCTGFLALTAIPQRWMGWSTGLSGLQLISKLGEAGAQANFCRK